ncbi:metallophosphoesterase [Spirulina sp. CS-785/01]|uniref:metallophosphoesterase n=1 Tax=Spirulina sp. CS-785/01 TaxID=3021716 RepID=UPI00232D53F0|nr:metallophosphoesterase [Spirulina sp. CS-785/01]MDB9312297.1 metallophosphoesterase [Spirulina sp. CS-785/01]
MITIAQLTDTHLLAQKQDNLRGSNPWSSLEAIVEAIAQAQPDSLLLTGDIADTGDRTAYEQAIALLSPLETPIYWLPGNHDVNAFLKTSFTHPHFHPPQTTLLGDWQLCTLDSTRQDARWGEGHLPQTTLHHLETQLKQTHRPTLIALHHHPLPTGIEWLDMMGLQNAEDFLTLLHRFPQVKLVVFGHIHSPFHQQQGDIHFYGTPSTCVQLPQTAHTPTDKQPGFRLLHLHPDGTHTTEIQRVEVFAS